MVKRGFILSVFVLFGLLKDLNKLFGFFVVRGDYGFCFIVNVNWVSVKDNLEEFLSLVDELGLFLLL